MERTLTLTIDMDGVEEYAALWDEGSIDVPQELMYQGPLARFARLCQELGGVGTIFVVGKDLNQNTADYLRVLAKKQFEIANHSFSHDYRLSQYSSRRIWHEIWETNEALQFWLGMPVKGFRAPG